MDTEIKIKVNRKSISVAILVALLVSSVLYFSAAYRHSKNEKITIIADLIEKEQNSNSASKFMLVTDVDPTDINSIMNDVYSQRGGALYRCNEFLGLSAKKNGNSVRVICYFDGFRKYTAIQYVGLVGGQDTGKSFYEIFVFNK